MIKYKTNLFREVSRRFGGFDATFFPFLPKSGLLTIDSFPTSLIGQALW